MRNIIILLSIVLITGCSTKPMKGIIENGKYTNEQSTFEISIPNIANQKIVDGAGNYFQYVDFIGEKKAYSIEFFNSAGPENEESFKSGTESFMENYIPNKCGPNSFESVKGKFTVVSNNLSYDFVTKGVRPNGQKTFWYGRSIYLAPKKVALCMYYENRSELESIDDFERRFDNSEFDKVCSSIKPKI